MSLEFRGMALPLDEAGMAEVRTHLRVGTAEVWAVLTFETRGCGFLPDRRPLILFERHKFSQETGGRFDSTHPDLSNPLPGGYGAGGVAQHDRLQRAIVLDRRAALRSASWGIGQFMGFNAEIAGYANVEEMVNAMAKSENEQLLGMAKEICYHRLEQKLSRHDWAAFAYGYNGPAYAKNQYDSRLAADFQKYLLGPLPDLLVRAVQIYLTYLGYFLGPVDGLLGRFTRSALHDFQTEHGFPVPDEIDEIVLANLKKEVEKLSD